MKAIATHLAGVLVIEPDVFGDERGFFQEIWHQQRYAAIGIPDPFVQDNLSRSRQGVLRGLHFQNPNPQGKLIYVLEGSVFDVVVDIRPASPTYRQWLGLDLTAETHQQLYVPPGYAHGFCVTSETALLAYKCTDYYNPDADHSIAWNDASIGIAWPTQSPELSRKDQAALPLAEFNPATLPNFKA